MGLTGIFLILFLIVHVGLNACIWAMDGGVMFNKAAHFMGANIVPRLLEVGLFAGFLLHMFQGWSLELTNRAARKKGYAVNMGNKGSKWYSRSMGILGTLLFLFLVMHLSRCCSLLNWLSFSGLAFDAWFSKCFQDFGSQQSPLFENY